MPRHASSRRECTESRFRLWRCLAGSSVCEVLRNFEPWSGFGCPLGKVNHPNSNRGLVFCELKNEFLLLIKVDVR